MFLNEKFSTVNVTDSNGSNHFTRDIVLMCLYVITAVVALFGNYLVCKIIFAKNSKLRNSTYILVGNLAISDVIGGITIPGQWLFCSFAALEKWNLDFPCAVTKSLQVLSFYMSSLIMMLIAIERFISIICPMKPPFRSKLYVTITWIVTTLFVATSIGSAKVFEYFTPERLISCRIVLKFTKPFNSDSMRTQRVWGIWMGQYVVPLLVTAVLYAIAARKIWKQSNKAFISCEAMKHKDKQRKKVVLMLIIVVIVFTVCWLPLHALNFTDYVIKQIETKQNIKKGRPLCNDSTLYFSLYWFGISSCCYNPFIYWWMNAEFRRGFKKLLPNFIVQFMKREPSTIETDDDQIQMNIIATSPSNSEEASSASTRTTPSGSKTSADG